MVAAVQSKWVVYAKRPFAGPEQVLAYLSRYTHRVAISPRRFLTLNHDQQTVTFSWKDYAEGGRRKTMTLNVKEFLRRFCLHLLPERFVKIRHYGFLTNRKRRERVAQARKLLPSAASASEGLESEKTSPEPQGLCPHCGSKRLVLMEVVAPTTAPQPVPLDSS